LRGLSGGTSNSSLANEQRGYSNRRG
jgi:hypothetical protein